MSDGAQQAREQGWFTAGSRGTAKVDPAKVAELEAKRRHFLGVAPNTWKTEFLLPLGGAVAALSSDGRVFFVELLKPTTYEDLCRFLKMLWGVETVGWQEMGE